MADGMSLSIGDWKKLAKSGELELKVVSNSMYPTLKVGDLVKVAALDKTPVKGVVTVFYKASENPPLIVHRCLGNMRFRGDNRVVDDPPVTEEQIVGFVKEFVRDGNVVKIDDSKLVKLHGFIRRVFIRTRSVLGKLKRLVKRK